MRRRLFVHYISLGDALPGPELAITIVVDDSGSMSGEPITQVRQALRKFIQEAPEGTTIGLVGFGSAVKIITRPTEYREFALDQVDRFQGDSGGTMLYDALGDACGLFAPDSRRRYVLVLTDGGDTGSERFTLDGDHQHTSIIGHAVGVGAKFLVIGFGAVNRSPLERLANDTGGLYLDAGNVTGVVKALERALERILEDGGRTLLRPEFNRLLSRSQPGERAWLREISIDPWNEDRLWTDESHLRFSDPAGKTVASYCAAFAGFQGEVQNLLETQVREQADKGVFPPDVDHVVVGWLHDPAFRAVSLGMLEVFRASRERLIATLPGAVYPGLVILCHELGTLPRDVQAECYGWLVAAFNIGGGQSPRALLVCGDSNQHRQLNPHGYSGIGKDKIIQTAANALRVLVLDPGILQVAVDRRPGGACALSSVGAASLDGGIGEALERSGLDLFDNLVGEFRERPAASHWSSDQAETRFRQDRLDLVSIKEELLAPPASGSAGGALAAVSLRTPDFWPPPREIPESDYLPGLPLLIDQRGAEYLYRKLESLRRTIAQRARDMIQSVTEHMAGDVDEALFRHADSGQALADSYLKRVVEMLGGAVRQIGQPGDESSLEVEKLFAADWAAVRTIGTLAADVARERLEERIRWRPRWEALAVRHGFLAVIIGLLGFKLGAAFAPLESGQGPLQIPSIVGGLAVLVTLAVGAVRWQLARKRLKTAIDEYVGALVREARAAAIRASLEQLREFYQALLAWIGRDPSIPAWQPEQVRTEDDLTERQRIAVLASYLQAAADLAGKRFRETGRPENHVVWEVGREVDNPAAPPPRLSLRLTDLESEVRAEWSTVASGQDLARWREVCRRKRCEDLDSYLAFHQERLEIPRRLLARIRKAISAAVGRDRRIADILAPQRFPQLPEVLPALDSVAAPPLRLVDSPSIPQPDRFWLCETGEMNNLRTRWGGDPGLADLLNSDAHQTEATCAIHRLWHLQAPILEAADWRPCHAAFNSLDETARRAILETWGSPDEWLDPATGQPCFVSSASEVTPDPGTDTEEGLL